MTQTAGSPPPRSARRIGEQHQQRSLYTGSGAHRGGARMRVLPRWRRADPIKTRSQRPGPFYLGRRQRGLPPEEVNRPRDRTNDPDVPLPPDPERHLDDLARCDQAPSLAQPAAGVPCRWPDRCGTPADSSSSRSSASGPHSALPGLHTTAGRTGRLPRSSCPLRRHPTHGRLRVSWVFVSMRWRLAWSCRAAARRRRHGASWPGSTHPSA